DLLLHPGGSRAPSARDGPARDDRAWRSSMTAANLPALVQRFFTERLRAQIGASPHTVASYRDTFRLLLVFASARLARAPSQLNVEDLNAALVGAFLDHHEKERTSTPKTRNVRLTAVRA